jgi:hypothetical protein
MPSEMATIGGSSPPTAAGHSGWRGTNAASMTSRTWNRCGTGSRSRAPTTPPVTVARPMPSTAEQNRQARSRQHVAPDALDVAEQGIGGVDLADPAPRARGVDVATTGEVDESVEIFDLAEQQGLTRGRHGARLQLAARQRRREHRGGQRDDLGARHAVRGAAIAPVAPNSSPGGVPVGQRTPACRYTDLGEQARGRLHRSPLVPDVTNRRVHLLAVGDARRPARRALRLIRVSDRPALVVHPEVMSRTRRGAPTLHP